MMRAQENEAATSPTHLYVFVCAIESNNQVSLLLSVLCLGLGSGSINTHLGPLLPQNITVISLIYAFSSQRNSLYAGLKLLLYHNHEGCQTKT